MGLMRRHPFARPLVILLAFAAAGVVQECKCKPNGNSDSSNKDFVMFDQNEFLYGLSLDGYKSVIDPSRFYVGSYSFLDFDAAENVVYYNSRYPNNKLHRLNLDNGNTTVLTPDVLSRDVQYVAFDWNTKNLYYVSFYYADFTSLNVLNTRDPTYSKIVLGDLARMVRSIALHPNKGYLYIAQLDDSNWSGKISRIATDGSNLKVIVEISNIQLLGALTIDYDEDRVYWSEGQQTPDKKIIFRVRHSDLDGQNIQEISLPSTVTYPSYLDVHGDSIYAIGDRTGNLMRVNKKDSKQSEVVVNTKQQEDLSGLKVFSGATQQILANHPCAGDHGCAKFCFAVPSTGGLKDTCGCPYGEKLAADGKSCEDNSKAEPPFVACDAAFKCNKQTK